MPEVRKFEIKGTEGRSYDLDNIAKNNTRIDASSPFVLYIHRYNPLSANKEARSPIPLELKIGSIWISRIDNLL